jgi:hypothetical protein
MAPEAVFHFRTGSSGERRSHFAVNPTTWALKAFADLRLEARKALLQDSCGMEVRLYLSFSCHYARKLVFQIDGALLGVASNLGGKLPYFRHVGHCMSPRPGRQAAAHGRFSKSEACWVYRVSLGPGNEAITKSADTATFQRAPDTASCSACISRLLTSCGIVVAKVRRIGERLSRRS